MNEGAWINARTGKFAWIDEHARWIQRETNAKALGLPDSVYANIKTMRADFNGDGREGILAAVMNAGFIRMRGHGSYWTFEFTMATVDALKACEKFLAAMAGPMTQCRFNNLRTGEAIEMPYAEFQEKMMDEPENILRVASQVPTKTAFTKGEYKLAKGYPRLMQIMKGQVPSIHTFGIMSADNPMNQQVSAADNKANEEKFKNVLKSAECGYVMHNGMYDRMEHAFFIMNVQYDQLVKWCDSDHFNQESFIYGEVDHNSQRVTIKLVEHGVVISTREVALVLKDGAENYFSEYKGRKFQIPFFDDAYMPTEKDTNVPVGVPFQGSEVETPENLPHLSTIYTRNEGLRLAAYGLKVGMGAWADRGLTLAALRKLKLPK